MTSFFPPSPDGLIVGNAEAVGVRYFPSRVTKKFPPLRIFYPARATASKSKPAARVGWFQDTGVVPFLSGYLHFFGIKEGTWMFRILSSAVIPFLSLFFTMRWRKLPADVRLDAPVADEEQEQATASSSYPVIIFSHGLSGTGQENSVLFAAWAKQGYVVVSIHHTDGSSVCVERTDGSHHYYQHGPSFANYDPSFRPTQIQHRAHEMRLAVDFLRHQENNNDDDDNNNDNDANDIRSICNLEQIVGAGFSYGAATAALASVQNKTLFKGLLLLDGWFYIDVSESAGIEFDFPKQAFDDKLHVPSLFVNSQQFAGYPKLYEATCRLVTTAIPPATQYKQHVIHSTHHNNFCDVIFWFPSSWLSKFGVIGSRNVRDAYQEIIQLTTDFLKVHLTSLKKL